jgi:oligosaccharide repeat unit polymerase
MRFKNAMIVHIAVAILQLIIFLLPLSIDFYKVNLLLLFFYVIISAFYLHISIYHPYILFLGSFFLFMLSRIFVDVLGGGNFAENDFFIHYTFSTEIQFKIILLLSLSLVFMHLGAIFAWAGTRKYQCFVPKVNQYSTTIKKIALIMFYTGLIPFSIRIFVVIQYVMQYGYISMYTLDKNIISNPILALSDDVCTIGFYLFLATFPPTKELKLLSTLYIILLILSLGMGQRGPAISQILVLISYFGLRNLINKKVFVISLISLIFLSQAAFLFRMQVTPTLESIAIMSEKFLSIQGVSIMVLGLSVENEGILNDVSLFSPLLYIVRNSAIAEVLGFEASQVPTGEYAMSSHSLGDVLSYKTNPELYFEGSGIGSAMVAEFYAWAWYIGVIIGSFLFIYLVIYMFERYKHSMYGLFFLFFILPGFFFAPRSSPLLILNDLIRPAIILLSIILIINYSQRKIKKNNI